MKAERARKETEEATGETIEDEEDVGLLKSSRKAKPMTLQPIRVAENVVSCTSKGHLPLHPVWQHVDFSLTTSDHWTGALCCCNCSIDCANRLHVEMIRKQILAWWRDEKMPYSAHDGAHDKHAGVP